MKLDAKGFDFIVVGGGTAGCILASRLAEPGEATVLLVESGPPDRARLLSIPGAAAKVSFDPAFHWGWMTEPQPGLNGRAQLLVQAKVLGGGSSVNGMVYSRGNAAHYDAWAAMGADGWDYESVLPFFRRSEASERGEGRFHGADGPVRVRRGASPLPIAGRMLTALEEAGFPIIDDLNIDDPDGFGWNDWTIADGRRASASAAFLGATRRPRNLTILTGATVLGIDMEGARATGIRLAAGREVMQVTATREVLLTAGAVGSARLLLLSGIGPADDLRRLGIRVAADLPQVGRNLSNHIAYALQYGCEAPVTARRYIHPVRGPIETGRYMLGRRGFLSNGAAPVGGFFRSRPDLQRPDMQLFAVPALPGPRRMPRRHGFIFSINQGCPASRGTVTLRSADPAAAPIIDPAYLSDPEDVRTLADAVETLADVARQPALQAVGASEIAPGPALRSRPALEDHIRSMASNYFHVSGTCRMGRSPSNSVTTPDLRVHGIDGLSVADAGVMPQLVNGNTNAPVMMIAERASVFAMERAA